MWAALAYRLLAIIYEEVSPDLKQAALHELEVLAARESGDVVIQDVLKVAEAFLAVVPETLPT